MRQWTKQQWDAITARRGTVLVSAAAGSGKTSVLVERVIQRLTDPQNPTPADQLLVVTFTNAAAAEMRERIEKAVLARMEAEPENAALRRQYMLVPKMNVSTVHSFCARLVREFFYVLDIAPDFKIVSDKLRDDLIEEALGEITDEAFAAGAYTLADAFSTEREDKKLYMVIRDLYAFTNSHLFPQKWLAGKLAMYTKKEPMGKTPWGNVLCAHLQESMYFCKQLLVGAICAMEADAKLVKKYSPVFKEDLAFVQTLLQHAADGHWDTIVTGLGAHSFGRLGAVTGEVDISLKNRATTIRDAVKDCVKIAKKQFVEPEESCAPEIAFTGSLVQELITLTEKFGQRFAQKKQEKKLADYNDLEHWAIQLLLTEQDGIVVPSEIANGLSERFAEIMVDEYQDTNEVQDWLFRALSKNDTNKFMVGDVKQCIYSFRQAMPQIFIGYKDSFSRYVATKEQYPATIVLDRNYRSRDTVIDSVNYVFQNLMSREAGGVDYTADEALVQGASYPVGTGYDMQLDFLENQEGVPVEISEARHIAGVIRSMLDQGLQVSENGKQRPARYGDFCILLRNANRFAYVYAQVLQQAQVPAWAQVAEGFFATPEIAQVLAFLQVIDNPNQDIPLLSVLMGPIYGFSPDDLGQLRVQNRRCSLYTAVLLDKSGTYTRFLLNMENYRLMAAHLSAEQMIDYLYTQTGYTELVLAMEGGTGRLANLRQLRQYAGDFESSGFAGLDAFLRFVQRLKESKADLEGANLACENADLVRVMSIHKSKGLEFPVCIIAGCGRKKHADTADVVLHSQLGLGLKRKEPKTGARYTNVVRDAILLQNSMDAMSEEMRVLYVAMTRAKEKLVVITTFKKVDTQLSAIAGYLSTTKITPYAVKHLSGMGEWLLLCALKHPMGQALRGRIGLGQEIVDASCHTSWDIRLVENATAEAAGFVEQAVPAQADLALLERLQQKLDFVYPNGHLNQIPVRVTASALAQEQGGQQESLPRPGFLSSKGLTPAERGIALHSYMQFCNFTQAAVHPEQEALRLVQQGFITKEEGESLTLDKVHAFFESPLGKRMLQAPQVLKEQRFTASIPASLVNPSFPADTETMLQGAVDCAFFENEKLYIVDFKTDRVKQGHELVHAYGIQLKLYAKALEQVMGVPIGGCYLYSLHLNQSVTVNE